MMNKQRKTSHILNVFQYDETTGAVTLPSTLVLTAPASDDNSTKVGTTAWVRTYVSGLSYATQSYVTTAIANLVASAPATLDTLNELAAALGNDAAFSTTITTSIGTKVPQARTITINGTSYDLTANRSWTINSMVYPAAGIALSTGSAWGTSITDNSANWNTAFGWGNHASAGYLTSALAATTYASLTGSYANPSWITSLAYSKITGVPAFITSYTETDTLATVTGRGASTSTAVTFSGGASISNLLINGAPSVAESSLALGAMGTAEGGQLTLNKATSYTYAAHIDVWNDSLRFLYGTNTATSGVAMSVNLSNRQLILPLYTTSTSFTGTAAGVLAFDSSGNIITIAVPSGGGAVSSVNAGTGVSVNATTGAVTVSIGQSVATSATPSFDQVITTNNGNGTNFRIGDDAWIGDINAANTFRVQGLQDATQGYIVFGNSNATALGRSGTGALTYGGNTIYHAGNLTNLNQLTNGPGYITGYTETDPYRVTAVAVSGTSTKTITLTRADASTVTTTWTDIDTDTNTYVTSAGFSGGTLTLTRNDAGTVTVSLDGRYYLASNPSSYITSSSLTSYVPYTGATANIDTGGYSITAGAVTLTSNLWLKNIGTYDFIMSNGTSLTTNTIRAYYNTSDELRFYAKSTAGAAVVPKIMVGDGTTFYTIYHGGNIPTWNQNTTGNAATATYATNSTRLYASDGVYVYGGAAPYYGYLTYDGTYWLFQVTPATPSGVRVARADTAGSATSAGSAGLLTHNASRTDGTRYNIGWFTGASSPAYSCDAVQIRSSDGNIFATSYRGSGNVGGTGEASNHPAGIYSQGTNWLYGTIYMNNNVINDAGNITMISNAGIQYSSTHWLRPRDSSGNMHLKADTGGIYLDAGIIHFRNAAGGADTTISSGRLNFGDSGATPYANPTGTSVGISFGGWESSSLRTYGIFTELENVGGNYSKLTFNYHTGIRFGASSSYGGTRFYNNYVGAGSETFSINNGDNHVRVAYNLYVGGTISGSNLSGTNTGDQTNISGNAATATSAGYLTGGDSAAYMILGNITSGDLNTYNTPGLYSSEYNGVTNRPIDSTGHWIQISDAGGTDVKTQWYYHSNGTGIYMRLMWGNGTWRAWRTLITDSNIGSQTVASAGNATTAGGLAVHSSTNNEANKIVRTDVNGYIQAGWINSISGNMGFENRIARITCSTDQYMRYQTLTEFKVSLGMSGKNDYSRRIDYTSDANYHVGSFGHGGTDIGNPDRIFHYGSGFFDVWSGAGTYAPGTSHIHGFNALHYTTGYGGNAYGWQMASQYNQTGLIYARWCSGGSFSAWQTIITSANIGSQSVSYASTAGSAPANGGNSTTVGGVGIGNIVRNDTTGQYLRAFYQYGSYLTSETPINLVDQGIQGGGLRVDFMHPSYTGSGNWNHVITWSGYNGYNMYQLGGNYDGGTGTDLWVRSEANHGRTSWTSWRRLLNTSSDSYAANMNQYVRTSDAPSFAGLTVNSTTTLNAQVYINRHIDANTTWGSCGCNTIFVGWSSGKVVLGNGNSGGHDYANGLGSNSVVSTNPFYCYQDITAYSDSRVKENVEVVDNAVEKIKAIRGVTFTRNDVEDKTKRHAGVIAQEVLAVLPEAVSEDLNGHYSVAYGNMAALFIEAIKEQQLQIEELKNKLDNVLSSR